MQAHGCVQVPCRGDGPFTGTDAAFALLLLLVCKRCGLLFTSRACVQMRVPMSKDERKALKARQRAGMSAAAALDDFADDVAGVLDVGDGEKAYFDKVRLGQKFGGDLSGGRAAAASGGACSTVLRCAQGRLGDETLFATASAALSCAFVFVFRQPPPPCLLRATVWRRPPHT